MFTDFIKFFPVSYIGPSLIIVVPFLWALFRYRKSLKNGNYGILRSLFSLDVIVLVGSFLTSWLPWESGLHNWMLSLNDIKYLPLAIFSTLQVFVSFQHCRAVLLYIHHLVKIFRPIRGEMLMNRHLWWLTLSSVVLSVVVNVPMIISGGVLVQEDGLVFFKQNMPGLNTFSTVLISFLFMLTAISLSLWSHYLTKTKKLTTISRQFLGKGAPGIAVVQCFCLLVTIVAVILQQFGILPQAYSTIAQSIARDLFTVALPWCYLFLDPEMKRRSKTMCWSKNRIQSVSAQSPQYGETGQVTHVCPKPTPPAGW